MQRNDVENLVNKIIEAHCKNDSLRYDETLRVIEANHEQVRTYILEDLEWKKTAQLVIEAFNNISTTGKISSKIIIWTAKITIAIGVIIGTILAIKEWVNKP